MHERSRDAVETELTFLGVFGLEDTLRAKVDESISKLLRANVDVRLISGDHLDTAKHWALQAGIITREEYNDDEVCFNGSELFDIIGETPVNVDGRGWQYSEERAEIV